MPFVSSFIKNPKDTRFYGEDNDEHTLYVIRRSFITNIPWIFSVAILLVIPIFLAPYLAGIQYDSKYLITTGFLFSLSLFWYLFTFSVAFINFVTWYFNVYIITNKRIIDVDYHSIFYKNISETTLTNVEDVTSTVIGSINVIFNIGDVVIQTAGERREFDFESVNDPSKLRDIITDLVAAIKSNGNN